MIRILLPATVKFILVNYFLVFMKLLEPLALIKSIILEFFGRKSYDSIENKK
jgi:hypothetical protein